MSGQIAFVTNPFSFVFFFQLFCFCILIQPLLSCIGCSLIHGNHPYYKSREKSEQLTTSLACLPLEEPSAWLQSYKFYLDGVGNDIPFIRCPQLSIYMPSS